MWTIPPERSKNAEKHLVPLSDQAWALVQSRPRFGGGNALASLKEEVAAAKKGWLAEWGEHLDSEEMPINRYRVIRDLMRTVDRDNVIITHGGWADVSALAPTFPQVAETPVTVDFCPGLSTPVRDTRGQGQPRPFSSISLPQVTSEHSSHDE